MITQNPIIGQARKKISGVYARTLYGKNVIQTCPPSTKGKQTQKQISTCTAFAALSKLSNQIPQSLLNRIFYSRPAVRSRRAEWCKQLAVAQVWNDGNCTWNPNNILQLGSNPVVCKQCLSLTINQTSLRIAISEFSAESNAITTEIPCIILFCPETNICISLLDYTTIEDDEIVFGNLSSTLLGKVCYLFPLWLVNVGTSQTNIFAYGSYRKNNN